MSAVHQLLPVLSAGDAIGGAVLSTRRMLRDMGFESEIYADVIDARLQREARPSGELAAHADGDDTVLYHLSTGSHVAGLFASLPARRVVVYHNITPPQYFETTSPMVALQLVRGREQLHHLASTSHLCIADSEYNADEARDAGYERVVVVPPPVDLARLAPEPGHPVSPPEVLFVGRFAVNKRHDTLVRALAVLRGDGVDCRLVLTGPADDNAAYVNALRSLATRLHVVDALDIHAGRVSDRDLRAMYMRASAFATASEHEGYCVPVVEAMGFALPVVARAAGAIPDTLAGAGLLVDGDDPLTFAACIARVLSDDAVRAGLVAAGSRRLQDFSHERIAGRLREALGGVVAAA